VELALLNQRVFVLPAAATVDDEVSKPLLSSESSSPTINDRDQLSPRERRVAICLAQGKSNKGIARLCEISEATVKVHLKAILRKTRLKNRTQAAVWAIRHGFGDDYSKRQVSADASTPSPADATDPDEDLPPSPTPRSHVP
jgi:two-component system nitrate/nitrite response regulator NarL